MIKSPKFTHSKKDNNKAQGRSTHLTAIVVSLVLSIIMITISVFNVSAVVIDVSSHDGLIDWNRIEEHVEGVIIRIGYGNDIEGQDDKQAIRNMNECERLGIPYGVYIYSYALTSDEVTSEINHTLRMLHGRSPVRGVWFDMEDADGYKESNGLDVYKDGELLTDFCIQFIEAMDKEGYKTGVYANYNYYKNVLNLERLANTRGFNMWLAHWGIEEPGMDCMMWQFGAYLIDGHEFDGNIFYADYSSPFKDRPDTDDNGENIERIDKAAGSSAIEAVNVDTNVNVIYRAQIRGSYWLPEVVNDEDYAGIQGTGITGITLSTDKGYAVYRVYAGGRWLSYVDSRNSDINDYYNGYAGNGAEIEAVEVYYYTPASLLINEATPYATLKDGRYHYAYYRVSRKNMDYYSDKMCELLNAGADIIGGCCGTTPDYIDRIASKADFTQNRQGEGCDWETDNSVQAVNTAFYHNKEGKKLIAVELAPPFDSNADKLLDAAHYLKSKGVDVLTFPDSPSGRTRADSILMAEKVSRQTGMCVMPHLCCRDKNAIAIRSQILGADINGINNFLVITGDPIPSVMRSSVKSVFNFDSVGFMNILDDMNSEQFADQPVTYGGAINQGRKRLDIEIGRVKKKMEAGATFFMTQPAFCDEDIERIATIKKETGARILCGIMPLVSFKNASFMKNEMTGINVTDEVLLRYRPDMTKEEGEQAGIDLAVEIINKSIDIVDGYYFSFPFIRVHMLDKIIKQSELYVNN